MNYFCCPYYHQPVMPARAVTIEQLQPLVGKQVIVNYANGGTYIGTLTEVDAAAGIAKVRVYEYGREVFYLLYMKNIVSIAPFFGGGGFGVPGGGFGGMSGGFEGGAFGGFGV